MEADISHRVIELWTLLLPIIVPYVTALIKKIWLHFISKMPRWLGPLKAIVAGWVISYFGSVFGVELPSDLLNITETQVTGILLSGAVIGAIGTWIRDLFHAIKKEYGSDTFIGKIVRVFAGQ